MVKTLVDDAGEAYVKQLAQSVPAASISDKATQELTALGFEVRVQSRRAKIASLIDAIEAYCSQQEKSNQI